jgi:DNA-binding MarR family transcriptional regulator
MANSDRFVHAAQAFVRGLGRRGRERARATDVTPQQAEALQIIAERETISASMFASLLGIDPSTASRNLAGLERAGFVSRRKARHDARRTDVRLTPRGARRAEAVASEVVENLTELMGRLSHTERQRVTEALEILARAVDGVSS